MLRLVDQAGLVTVESCVHHYVVQRVTTVDRHTNNLASQTAYPIPLLPLIPNHSTDSFSFVLPYHFAPPNGPRSKQPVAVNARRSDHHACACELF